MYRLPSDYDHKPPRVTVTELSVSSPTRPNHSKLSAVAYIEHNEFIEVVRSPRKKGLVSFLKNLNGAVNPSNRMRNSTSTEKHNDRSQKQMSLGISHDRVEALMGKPKDSVVKSPSPRSNDSKQHPLTKNELQSMFTGAPCFNISKMDGKLHGQVEFIGNMYEHQAEHNEAGTVAFEQFLQHKNSEKDDSSHLTTDDILQRVLQTFGAEDEILRQASTATNIDALEASAGSSSHITFSAAPTASYAANVEACSHPFGSAHSPSRQDFNTPTDGLPVLGNEAQFNGFSRTEKLRLSNDIPSISFTSPINSKLQPLKLSLFHSVHFVSSYPCYPVLKPANSKPQAQGTVDGWGDCLPSDFLASDDEDRAASPTDSACSIPALPHSNNACPGVTGREVLAHPLYKEYQYEVVPVALLLSLPEAANDLLNMDAAPHVLVLDCRGREDLGLLAGAWCAQMGEHAVVAKVGRTCLACSVRQARALGISVVIRL